MYVFAQHIHMYTYINIPIKIFCNIVRLYIYQLVALKNARSKAVFADNVNRIGVPHRVWHHKISSSIII